MSDDKKQSGPSVIIVLPNGETGTRYLNSGAIRTGDSRPIKYGLH